MFFGGKSTEHDISVITGVLTLNALDKTKFAPLAVFVDKDGSCYCGEGLNSLTFYKNVDYKRLKKVFFSFNDNVLYCKKGRKIQAFVEVNAAINCMHGVNGEDGSLCGVMQLCGVPLVSPDIFCSAVSIDKDCAKLVLNALGVPNADYETVERDVFFKNKNAVLGRLQNALGFPQIVKPARLGSSIGIKKVENEIELENAVSAAFSFDCKVVCERYLPASLDVNVAVYRANGKVFVSPPEEAFTANDLLTFEDKYCGAKNGANLRKSFSGNKEISEKMREYAKLIYERLGFSGIVRFDFLSSGGEVYLNEINAVPGSMAYYLFCDKISDFSSLLCELIASAEGDFRKKANCITSFNSSVLSENYSSVKK